MALDSWNEGPAKTAIVEFVHRAAAEVAPEDRIAVFDNDGTLWCEKPAYIQLDFLVRRLAQQAAADPDLRDTEPYRAAAQGDLSWFDVAVTKHCNGDHSDLAVLARGILAAYAGLRVEEHAEKVRDFFAEARHPTLGRHYTGCTYAPMVELLRYLEAADFTTFIVSGGGRDFLRPVTAQLYGIPPERVIGSSVGLDFADGHLRTTAQPEFLDDGPVKPVRIWGRTGRRPIFAAGNSNGDIEMMEYTTAGRWPSMALLIHHDDAGREFAYTAGAERVMQRAAENSWMVASMRADWSRVFDG